MVVRLQKPTSPPLDFNFHSGRSSPSSTSPPSPKPFTSNRFFFLSAPASPTRDLVEYDDDFSLINPASEEADDFAFHVGEVTHPPSVSAEELFHGGIIRSINAPSNETLQRSEAPSPPPVWRPMSESKGKKGFWSAFTPKWKKPSNTNTDSALEKTEHVRGRSERDSTRESRARSLSPIRVSRYPWEDEKKVAEKTTEPLVAPSSSTALTLSTSSKSSKRWRLKDLLLFRSASEGRSADKDPLRKLTALYNRQQEEMKSSSFGSVSRRGRVSAHERHYAMNKAVSDDMKKKTFLPYKQGILGGFQGFGG